MAIFKGAGVAIITPFTETGIDWDRFRTLLNWHVEQGTNAIVVCGTTGEASTMTETEKKDAIKFTVEVIAGRIPVIAGTGTNNTSASIAMSKYAESVGADALLVINPYYNKTSSEGLYRHFKAINDEVNIPIVVYNVPSRTGMNISAENLERLATLGNVKAVKEASGDIAQIARIRRLLPGEFQIFSGNDDQVVPIMALGGDGVISVTGNLIPKAISDMTKAFLEGDVKEALRLQMATFDITSAMFIETNPIPLKAAMKLEGLDSGILRLPLWEITEPNLVKVEAAMKAFGLLGGQNG